MKNIQVKRLLIRKHRTHNVYFAYIGRYTNGFNLFRHMVEYVDSEGNQFPSPKGLEPNTVGDVFGDAPFNPNAKAYCILVSDEQMCEFLSDCEVHKCTGGPFRMLPTMHKEVRHGEDVFLYNGKGAMMSSRNELLDDYFFPRSSMELVNFVESQYVSNCIMGNILYVDMKQYFARRGWLKKPEQETPEPPQEPSPETKLVPVEASPKPWWKRVWDNIWC